MSSCSATAAHISFHSDICACTRRDGSDISRAVISKNAAPIAIGLAMPISPPRLTASARQKIGDQPPAFLGDFGQMLRQFGLIHLVSPAAFDRRRRNRSGSARLGCAFRFACRSFRLFPRLGHWPDIQDLKCSDAVPPIEYTACDHAEYRAGIRPKPEVRARRPPRRTGRVRRRRRGLHRCGRDLSLAARHQ